MLRPVESKLVLWNVDQRAQSFKDPSASLAQGLQQSIQNKKDEESRHRIQQTNETESQLKVRPDQEQASKKRGQDDQGKREEEKEKESLNASRAEFDFYA